MINSINGNWLQFFAEGAGADAATGDNASSPSGEGVVSADPGQDKVAERSAAYSKFIADNKDLYDADVNSRIEKAVKDRLKRSKDAESRYAATEDIRALTAKKYGIADIEDVAAITKAMMDDDSIWEEEAYNRNSSAQEVRRNYQLERENESLKAAFRREAADRRYNELMEEAEKMKAIYPDFDINVETKNKDFMMAMQNGKTMQQAYAFAHMDDLVPQFMATAAQDAAKKVADSVKANASRPRENALGAESAAAVHVDVSKMTKAQRQEYISRSMKGERITFKK